MAKSFDELANRVMSPKARARAAARADHLRVELLLSEVRKLAGKSQSELARALGVKQPSLSKLEHQDDMQVSTLKKIIESLGGEVCITARFQNREVRLGQFGARRKPSRRLQELHRV